MIKSETDLEARQRRRRTQDALVSTLLAFARENGLVPWKDEDKLAAAFPDLPEIFFIDVWTKMDMEETDAYLDALSKTVEAEIIRRAIGGGTD